MKNKKTPILNETEKFIDSLISQSFFLMQVDFSSQLLKKTNAYKMKKSLQKHIKQMSNDIAKKQLNSQQYNKPFKSEK